MPVCGACVAIPLALGGSASSVSSKNVKIYTISLIVTLISLVVYIKYKYGDCQACKG